MPTPDTILAVSTIYVRTPITAKATGVSYDPTGDTVTAAFMPPGVPPGPADMKPATWEIDPTTTPVTYYARCLVGPAGDTTLTPGLWSMFVKIVDNPEQPVLHAGPIRVL